MLKTSTMFMVTMKVFCFFNLCPLFSTKIFKVKDWKNEKKNRRLRDAKKFGNMNFLFLKTFNIVQSVVPDFAS